MAVRSESNRFLFRDDTSFVTRSIDAMTIMCWGFPESSISEGYRIFDFEMEDQTRVLDISMTWSDIAADYVFSLFNGASSTRGPVDTPFPSSAWKHLTLTCGGTGADQLKVYVDGVEIISSTLSTSSLAPEWMGFASGFAGTDTFHMGTWAGWKEWDRMLSADEIKSEVYQYAPISSGCQIWTPMCDYTDALTHYGPKEIGIGAMNPREIWLNIGGTMNRRNGPPGVGWKFRDRRLLLCPAGTQRDIPPIPVKAAVEPHGIAEFPIAPLTEEI